MMSGNKRKKIYTKLAKEYGEVCQFCHNTPEQRQLVIDHKDNNNTNNFYKNLQLLCRRCNYIKNPRRPVDVCERDREMEEKSELQVSQTKKPHFKHFVWHEINERTQVPQKELLDAAAEELDISQVTAKRWLDAMCSSRGCLEKITLVKITIIRIKQRDVFQ